MATVEPTTASGAAPAKSRPQPAPEPEPKTSSKALPTVPDKNCPIDQALQWWADANTLHPGRLIGYLYRLHPICKTKPSYTDIFPEPVTYQQILQERGSGEYKLHINDKDKSKWGEIIISRWKTKEHWTEFPPVLDPATLDLDHKDNKSYVEWLKSRGAGMTPNGNGSDAAAVNALAQTVQALLAEVRKPKEPGSDAAAFSKLADMFSAGHKASLDMALGQVKANSDEETIKRLTMMQALFAPKNGDSGKTSSTMETFLLQELAASRAERAKLFDRLLDLQTKPAAESTADPLVKGVMQRLLDRALDSLDNGGGKEISGKWGWLQMLQPEIGKALDLFGIMARRGAANPFRQQQAQPGQAAQPEVIGGLPAPEPAQTQTAEPVGDIMQQLGQFLQLVWLPMCTFIKKGQSGEDFCDYIAEGFGFMVTDHDQIKAMGKEKIMAMVQQQGAEALKKEGITMERFGKFLDEFLSWEPAPPTDDGGPVDTPPLAQQMGPAK